jgi:hypothetical protein
LNQVVDVTFQKPHLEFAFFNLLLKLLDLNAVNMASAGSIPIESEP